MLQFLLDTDHLTLLEYANPVVVQHVELQVQGAVGFPAVSVEESVRGRLNAVSQAKDGAARIARFELLLKSLKLFQ
jgi:hypothetical protein